MTTDEWISAQYSESGKPVLVRLQNVRLDAALEARFPDLVTVAVAYASPGATGKGLPTGPQYALLGDHEDALLDGLEERGDGVAAVVRTYDGLMTHRVYVADGDAVAAAFAACPCAYPTTVTMTKNDRWATFRADRAALPDE